MIASDCDLDQVADVNASLTAKIDNAVQYASNGKVGIGQLAQSPAFLLDVSDPASTSAFRAGNGNAGLEAGYHTDSGRALLMAYDRDAGRYRKMHTFSEELTFTTSDSVTDVQAMKILSDGKVGVGTASPTAVLTVASDAGANGIDLVGRSDDISQLTFRSNDHGTALSQIQSRSSQLLLKTLSAIPMKFHTGNAERMEIDANGYVGIGTGASNNAVLHLKRPDGTGDRSVLQLTHTDDGADAKAILAYSFGSLGSTAELIALKSDASGAATSLVVRTHDGGAWQETKFRSDGYMGVGVENPTQRVDVNGDVRADGIRFASSSHSLQPRVIGSTINVASAGNWGFLFRCYHTGAFTVNLFIHPNNGMGGWSEQYAFNIAYGSANYKSLAMGTGHTNPGGNIGGCELAYDNSQLNGVNYVIKLKCNTLHSDGAVAIWTATGALSVHARACKTQGDCS